MSRFSASEPNRRSGDVAETEARRAPDLRYRPAMPAPPPKGVGQEQDFEDDELDGEAFSARALSRQLALDAVLRWGVVAMAVGAMGWALLSGMDGSMLGSMAVVLVVLGWAAMNLTSVHVARDLPELEGLIVSDPQAAEQRLGRHLARRPLVGWVRLALYHRLARVRHGQRRHGQVVSICLAVMRYRFGPARRERGRLLLMLVESALNVGRLDVAHRALTRLHSERLSLVEALSRLALQMRYEVLAGHHADALACSERKIELAELMPALACGAVHAMLATAAQYEQQPELADRLWERARLLCTRDQLSDLSGGGFDAALTAAAAAAGERV